jgi:uncharacterized protein involved in outer membrane biogenesis
MRARRWLALIFGVLVIGLGATLYFLPELIRQVAIVRIRAMTQRSVRIDRVDFNVITGRATVHGFRLAERDGETAFADFKRLDLRLHLPSLLLGHLWLREMVLSDSTVRVVRLPTGEFNFSDLIRRSGTTGRALDVTVDHFVLTGGTVSLEDRAASERRTWTSEQIMIEARNVSTRRDDGSAIGRSVTAGAPVSVEVKNLRLHPIRLQATVTAEGLDLTPARVYLPPDAPVILDRGHASLSVTVALDAHDGIRADATGQFEDIALVRRDGGEPLALVPKMTTQVRSFALREGDVRLAQLAVEGTMSVRDPRAKQGAPFRLSSVRATVADLTWPATTPGRLDLLTSIPGGGTLTVTGTIRPPPAATQLRLRLANLDVAPWAQFLPLAARVTGLAEADLRMNEPLAAGIPARVQGSIAVNRLGVADARQELLGARRIEASGLEVHWPTRVVVNRVLVIGPRGTVERDRAGAFPLKDLIGRPAPSSLATTPPAIGSSRPPAAPALGVEIGEIVVRNGAMAWRDQTISPPALLEIASIDGRVMGIGWPLRGPADVRLALRPPGGGQMQVTGRVELDPLSADLRLAARNAELAPYQPYLPTAARVGGTADLDVAVVVPSLSDGRATARGSAAVSRLDVRDRGQTVMRVERANATGVDVDWPRRIAVGRLALAQPWMLVERDDKGALPLRALLSPSRPATSAAASTPAESTENGGGALAVTVARLSVDGGGMRIVDRAVSPAFAVDFQPATLRMEGLSTAAEKPARLDLRGRLGPGAELTLRGTLGALGGPLRFDVSGELREFAVARANPYVLQQAGWKTTEGRLTSKVQARVDGDALSAKTDIRVSRLQLVRAAPEDGAQARIGLPLNMITALMKDKHGDIKVSFPVGGRLSDPRFDFSEAIWNAVRTVAVRAITLPVSWIGRVHFTPDSRIQQIEVDPVPFEPGTSTLTAEGQAQATRLAAFLEELPDVKMALTPVVSSQDVTEIKRRALETTLDRVAREGRLSREATATRLFERAFPDRRAPDSLEAILSALLEREPAPTSEIPELAARRLEAVRATVKQAGIDPTRLAEMKLVQRDADGRIELDVLASETERPSKIRETLRRLGVPLKEK